MQIDWYIPWIILFYEQPTWVQSLKKLTPKTFCYIYLLGSMDVTIESLLYKFNYPGNGYKKVEKIKFYPVHIIFYLK